MTTKKQIPTVNKVKEMIDGSLDNIVDTKTEDNTTTYTIKDDVLPSTVAVKSDVYNDDNIAKFSLTSHNHDTTYLKAVPDPLTISNLTVNTSLTLKGNITENNTNLYNNHKINTSLLPDYSTTYAAYEHNHDGKYATLEHSHDEYLKESDLNPTKWVESLKFEEISHDYVGKQKMCICYGNGKFISLANKYVFSSTDGISWSYITLDDTFALSWNSVCYGNGKYVAVNWGSKAMYSEDGITWNLVNMTDDTWSLLIFANNMFISLSTSTPTKVAKSTDGIAWDVIELDGEYAGDICYGDGKFVIGTDYKIFYSEDGDNWTTIEIPNVKANKICYSNGVFLIYNGAANNFLYSSDLKAWNEITPTGLKFNYSYAFKFYQGVFFYSPYSNLYYSTDMINWTQISENITGLCFGNNRFVVCARESMVFTSNQIENAVSEVVFKSDIYNGDTCKFATVKHTHEVSDISDLINTFYPVGSVFTTTDSTQQPGTLYAGTTWELITTSITGVYMWKRTA